MGLFLAELLALADRSIDLTLSHAAHLDEVLS